MGIDVAVHILIKMMMEFKNQFTEEDITDAMQIGFKLVYLWCKDRTEDEEEAFEVYKSSLRQLANQLLAATINEVEQYTTISKILKILT